MGTVIEQMNEAANELASLLSELLQNHSSIYKRESHYRGMVIISTEGNYSYNNLKPEGL